MIITDLYIRNIPPRRKREVSDRHFILTAVGRGIERYISVEFAAGLTLVVPPREDCL